MFDRTVRETGFRQVPRMPMARGLYWVLYVPRRSGRTIELDREYPVDAHIRARHHGVVFGRYLPQNTVLLLRRWDPGDAGDIRERCDQQVSERSPRIKSEATFAFQYWPYLGGLDREFVDNFPFTPYSGRKFA